MPNKYAVIIKQQTDDNTIVDVWEDIFKYVFQSKEVKQEFIEKLLKLLKENV